VRSARAPRRCRDAHRQSVGDDAQLLVENAQNAVEFVAAAHDKTGCGDHAVGALPSLQPWILFDAVDRNLGAAPEDREHGPILKKIDGLVTPFTGGDHTPIEAQDAVKFTSGEGYSVIGGEGQNPVCHFAPAGLAWIDFAGAKAHAAPPCCHPDVIGMIASPASARKPPRHESELVISGLKELILDCEMACFRSFAITDSLKGS